MRRFLVGSVIVATLTLPAPVVAVSDAVSPRQVVRSGDGLLTLTIPRGAVTKAVRIRIRTLKPSVLKGELRKAAAPGPVYELLPDGLRFAKPITITRRVKGLDLRKGVPVLVPASRQGNGRWTVLNNPRVEQRGDVVTTTGTTRHFSTVAAFEGDGQASLSPAQVKLAVGAEFKATVRLTSSRDVDFGFSTWSAGGSVDVLRDRQRGRFELEADLKCATAGTGSYTAQFEIEDAGSLFLLGLTFGRTGQNPVELSLSGSAECGGAEASLPLDFGLVWGHPAGAPSSFVCANITAASGAFLQLDATGPAGYSASGTLQLQKKQTATASGTFNFGIFQVGRYKVRITATAGGKSVTKTKTVEVTGAPGSPSCGR